MLELMRKHARNWLMKVILGIIIIVFIFYFGTVNGDKKAETIATIDDKTIAIIDFQREYQNLFDFYRQQYGDRMTDDLLKNLNLKQEAFDNIINRAIIIHKADKLNLEVTADEIRNSILSFSAFQKNGVFDDGIYRQILRSNKMTPEEFEDIQGKTLTIKKVENLIVDAVKVSEQEVHDLYRFQNEKINITFLQLSPKDFTEKVTPSQTDLETYLKVHGNDFRRPKQVQLKYISFLGQDFAPSVKVADIDVADYYEHHKDEFLKSDSKAAAPLSEVRDKIAAELKQIQGMVIAAEEAKKAHDTIYQKENFDGYATQKKLEIKTTEFFSLNNLPPDFSRLPDFTGIVSNLGKGDVSKILSNEKGDYIFKLMAQKPPSIPTLNEIKEKVEKRYIEEGSERLCKKASEDILDRMKKGEDIENIAREKGLKVNETGFFLPGSNIEKLGFSQELNEGLFNISKKKPYADKVFQISGNFILIQFKAREKSDDRDFEVKKEQLKNVLFKIKKNEYLKSWLEGEKAYMRKEGTLKVMKDIKEL
ncbi:MAG: SurA N-terminal domain-containing protein [Syntrophales bacterium]